MATEAVTAPELAALVKPVRALLTKNKKIGAIKLVRERTECGLKECKEFVEHVQAWPAARAEKVAELWVGITSGEAAADKAESEPQPAASSMEQSIEAPESADAQGVSLADWYARYMQTHTYAEWEQLVEKCIAAEKTEEETAFPTDGITGSKMGSGQCSARTDTLIQSAKPHEEEL